MGDPDAELAELADRIDALAEELADVAIGSLRRAVKGDRAAAAHEKQVTRARRALVKAAALLRTAGATASDDGE